MSDMVRDEKLWELCLNARSFEEWCDLLDYLIETEGDELDWEVVQGEGMHVVGRIMNTCVVYDEEGPRWVLGRGKVMGR